MEEKEFGRIDSRSYFILIQLQVTGNAECEVEKGIKVVQCNENDYLKNESCQQTKRP
jgi:hypothetical protein